MSKEKILIEVDHSTKTCNIEIFGDTAKIASDMTNVAKRIPSFKTALLLAAKYLQDEDDQLQQESEAFLSEMKDILDNHKTSKN